MKTKFYKDLTINQKINAKSWGFWRYPNAEGFILTMIDNANMDKREDYANYLRFHLVSQTNYQTPRRTQP